MTPSHPCCVQLFQQRSYERCPPGFELVWTTALVQFDARDFPHVVRIGDGLQLTFSHKQLAVVYQLVVTDLQVTHVPHVFIVEGTHVALSQRQDEDS